MITMMMSMIMIAMTAVMMAMMMMVAMMLARMVDAREENARRILAAEDDDHEDKKNKTTKEIEWPELELHFSGVWDTHSHYEDSKQAYQKLMAMASWDEFKTFIKVEAVLTNVDSSKVALIMNLLLRQLKYPEHYSWTVSILKVLFPTSARNAKIIERGDVALLKGLFMKMGDTKLYKATPDGKFSEG